MVECHLEITESAEKELLRIGNYRVIYTINDASRIVKILDLGHRKDIYR